MEIENKLNSYIASMGTEIKEDKKILKVSLGTEVFRNIEKEIKP